MVQYPGVAKGLYVASSSGLYGLCNVFLGMYMNQWLCQKYGVCIYFVFYYHHIDRVFATVYYQSDAWLSYHV